MEHHFMLNPTTNKLDVRQHPAPCAVELQRQDQMGLLDANYHGSAGLLLQQSSRSWANMDVFALDRLLEAPLMPYCLHLFCNVWSFNQPDADQGPALIDDLLPVARLARIVSEKYTCTNYYHTVLHGIDVTHSFSCLLQVACDRGILKLTRWECFVALLSALMHDIDHPGVTYDYFYDKDIQNFFKSKNAVKTDSPLSGDGKLITSYAHRQRMKTKNKRYLHSLESHQASMAVSVLRGSGLIDRLPESQQRQLCRLMMDLVESTDMNLHRSMSVEMTRIAGLFEIGAPPPKLTSGDHRLLLCLLLKCSDVSNPAKPWDYYFAWSRLITAEFFAQGDKERYIRGCLNPHKFVTHFCDRNLVTFETSQIGFIKFIRESFQQLDTMLDGCSLTRYIISQLGFNMKNLEIINHTKRLQKALDAKNSSSRLRVTLMVRTPDSDFSASKPTHKIKCRVLLCSRELNVPSSQDVRSALLRSEVSRMY